MRTASFFAHKFARHSNALLRVSSSAAALALGLSAAPAFAQEAGDDEDTEAAVEVVAVSGQEVEGETLGRFIPVVIGGEGDLLFANQGTVRDLFLTFDTTLDVINGIGPAGFLNASFANYSIDATSNQYVVVGGNGVATGNVGDESAVAIAFVNSDTNADFNTDSDRGNLLSGASPLILNGITAILVTDANSSDLNNATTFVEQDVLFVTDVRGEFVQPTELEFVSGNGDRQSITSLNFAGTSDLLISLTPQESAPNSGLLSSLQRIDLSGTTVTGGVQVGPLGTPQPGPDFLRGGQGTFAGFTFNGTVGADGLTAFGNGARFAQGEFSANSQNTAFVLTNALAGLDGSNSPEVPATLLALDNQVIAIGSTLRGLTTETSLGAVNFIRFEDVLLSENGDLFFRATGRLSDGSELDTVDLWRITHPGEANQSIAPALMVGDQIRIPRAIADNLFPESNGQGFVSVTGFASARQEQIGTISRDGRPRFFSVNAAGNLATVVQINTPNGTADAIVAQDENGVFQLVTFVGQSIETPDGELRTVTSFTAQFGSNDVDGAGDLFNDDEQLGFIVNFADFSSAVLRVSLNGLEVIQINEFLWDGACGDDEFFTQCPDSNWVNNADQQQRAPTAPGVEPGEARAIIRDANIRIATGNVAINSIDSDGTITLQNGRTLQLSQGGIIDDLVLKRGNVSTSGAELALAFLTIDQGTFTANGPVAIEQTLTLQGGDNEDVVKLAGTGTITVDSENSALRPTVSIIGNVDDVPELSTTLVVRNGDITVSDGRDGAISGVFSVTSQGTLEVTDGSKLTVANSVVGGAGTIKVSGASQLVSTGQSSVTTKLDFEDASRPANSQAAAAVVETGNLSVSNVTFSRTGTGPVDQTTRTFVSANEGGTFTVAQGGTLTVENDLVALQGAGAFDIDGTLRINRAGLIENSGTLDLSGGALAGEGAFINRGSLILANRTSQAPLEITNIFANLRGGTLADTGPLTFRTNAEAAAQNPIDLTALALTSIGSAQSSDRLDTSLSVALDFSTPSGSAGTRSSNISILGDGVAFLSGALQQAPETLIKSEVDTFVNLTISERAALAFEGPASGERLAVSILNEAGDDLNVQAQNGTVTFINTAIRGRDNASATGSGTSSASTNSKASILNKLIDAQLLQFFGSNPSRTVEGLAEIIGGRDPDDQDEAREELLSQRMLIQSSSIANLNVRNEGTLILQDVEFEAGVSGQNGVNLTNNRLLQILGETKASQGLQIFNESQGRLEVAGVADGLKIDRIENEGFVTFKAGDGKIDVISYFGPSGELGVEEGAIANITQGSLLENTGGVIEFVGKSITVAGTLSVSFGSLTPTPNITRIGKGAELRIREGGRVNSIDENGSGLTQIAGNLTLAGRFNGQALRIEDSTTTIERGIEAQSLIIDSPATLVISAPFSGDRNSANVDRAQIRGELTTSGSAVFRVLDVTQGGVLRNSGSVVAQEATINGSVQATVNDTSFQADSTTISSAGGLTVGDGIIRRLNIASGGRASFIDRLKAETMTTAGRLVAGEISGLDGSIGAALNITASTSDPVEISGAAALSSLQIDASRAASFGIVDVFDTAATTIDGTLMAGVANFTGALRLNGRAEQNNNLGALTAERIDLAGSMALREITTTNGSFSIAVQQSPRLTSRPSPPPRDTSILSSLSRFFFGEEEMPEAPFVPDLISDADVTATSIELNGGSLLSNGAISINGVAGTRVLQAGTSQSAAYAGSDNSFISINGDALLRGDLVLGEDAIYRQEGNTQATGVLRTSVGTITAVSGALSAGTPRGGNPTTTAANTIEPNRKLAQVLSSERVAIEDGEIADDVHSIAGSLFVGDSLDFGAEDVVLHQSGFIAALGDVSLADISIDGALITGGAFTADAVEVTGRLEFASANIGSLDVSADAVLIGDDFSVASDFTNLGTFVLGSLEGGPGEFSVEGDFINAGVFSGTGSLNGSLLQEAREGGPEANALLFSPGFSPGILNISGDATFNEGMVFMEIGGLTPGAEHDQVNVSGTLTFGSDAMLVIDLLEDESGELFLLGTGDEVILFTANDISPDDIEDINLAILDTLPVGFALVAEITTNADGEILRVLRGFNGSTLGDIAGLDISQAGVASALDFLSTSESGVPSQALFDLAVDLQFADTIGVQTQTLTQLSATNLSALQSTALPAGRYNMDFMTERLSASAFSSVAQLSSQTGAAAQRSQAPVGAGAAQGRAFDKRDFAQVATRQIQRSGGVSYLASDGSTLSLVASGAFHFGDQDSRAGTIGFDQDGWSASLGAEYETADGAFLVGTAVTLGESDADLDGGLGETGSESLGFGLYTWYDTGVVRLAAAASAADLDFEATRLVQGLNASGESDGNTLAFHAQAFAPLVRSDTVTLGPKVAFDWQDLEIDGFTEAGAGDFDLILPDLDRKASAFTLTGVGDFGFDMGRMKGAMHIELGYQITTAGDDFVARAVAFDAAPGTPFAAALRPLVNDGLRLRTGLSLFNERGLQVRAIYEGLFAENGQDQNSVQAQMRLRF